MHPALRKGPLFCKTPPIFHFFLQTPVSFPAYGPAIGLQQFLFHSIIAKVR